MKEHQLWIATKNTFYRYGDAWNIVPLKLLFNVVP